MATVLPLRSLIQHNKQHEPNNNLCNADEFTVPYTRIELFKKSLLFPLPTEWNLPTAIKLQHNKTTFDISLKDYLLSTLPIQE
jgi:hypothetical protein